MTGVTGMAVRREQKRFELLHAAAPNAPILGLLLDPQNPNQDARANDVLGPAQKIGVQIKLVRASAARDFGNVFAELAQSRAGGLVIADDEFFLSASIGLALRAKVMPKTSPSTRIKPGRVLHSGAVATPAAVIRKPTEVMPSTLANSDAVSSRGASMMVG